MKGIEIKRIGNNYYAYKSTTVWDKDKKKRRKVSRYLGKYVDGKIVKVREIASIRGVYELGNVSLLWHIIEKSGIKSMLQKTFPDEWEEIVLLAFNRVLNPQPLKSVKLWYEKTYLAKLISPALSPKSLSSYLREIGSDAAAQREFFRRLIGKDEKIVYDTTSIFTYSKNINLAELGYNKEHLLLPQINILLAFSKKRKLPCYIRVVPGSMMDAKTLRVFVEEINDKRAFIVLDKGFLSQDNFDVLSKYDINFIIPLRRNSRAIDYSKHLRKVFVFRGRAIKCTRYSYENFYVYLFEDILLRAEEENEFYNIREKGVKLTFNRKVSGKIALLSNVKANPEEIYLLYKSRDEIEKVFHAFKNVLQADRPYLRDDDSIRGHVFVSFVALYIYYHVLNKLLKLNLSNKLSVKDVLLELSKVYAIELNDRIIVSEIPKKAQQLANLFNLDIELFPKKVRS